MMLTIFLTVDNARDPGLIPRWSCLLVSLSKELYSHCSSRPSCINLVNVRQHQWLYVIEQGTSLTLLQSTQVETLKLICMVSWHSVTVCCLCKILLMLCRPSCKDYIIKCMHTNQTEILTCSAILQMLV